MIGSLLFYALYPLSRYVTSRRAEASTKALPAAGVNGEAVWDGGAVATRRFTRLQKTLLDQGLGPSGGTEERMTEPSPEEEDDTGPRLVVSVLREDLETGAASTRSELKPTSTEKEAETRNKADAPERKVGEGTLHHEALRVMQNTEGGIVFPAGDIGPEKALGAQKEHSGPVQEQVQIPTSAQPASEVTECWDDYVAPDADETRGGESSSKLDLFCLLSNTQSRLKLSGQQGAQASWHFPAGPGLADEVQCPLWQFPAVSYYPPIEPTVPFEVTWRVWEDMEKSATAAEPLPFTKASMDFTVMSYNILAQDLLEANPELYAHCPLEVLDWSYRCSLLLEEIQKWEPDILCLQEVQEDHYHEHLYPVLSRMGYSCVFKRRTGTKTDGCATCYRGRRFSELSVTALEFFRPEIELLDRHNVAVVLLLRPLVVQGSEVKAKGPPLCVANTHLLFNPRRGDVKLAQLAIMLAEIDSLVKSCKAKGEDCNLVLCGDFNSVPQMPLYQLITTSQLYFQGLPAWMVSGQEDLSHNSHCHRLWAPLWPSSLGITDSCQYSTVKDTWTSQSPKSGTYRYSHDFMQQLRFCPAACVRPADLEPIAGVTDNTPDASRGTQSHDRRFRHTISHQLELESVYKHILPGFGNPEVTTLHSEGGATVDYIFYTPRRVLACDHTAGDFVSAGLKLIGSLSLLSEDVLWSMRGLPNHMFPSDHLSLLAKFQLDLNAA